MNVSVGMTLPDAQEVEDGFSSREAQLRRWATSLVLRTSNNSQWPRNGSDESTQRASQAVAQRAGRYAGGVQAVADLT